jgi:hypothetical protein
VTEYAVPRTQQKVELSPSAVLKEAWALYKRLFARSIGIGAIVFGVVHFFDVVPGAGPFVNLISLVLAFAGIALVQGGLVEIVRGLHADGDDDPSLGQVLARTSVRLGKLVAVSLLSAIGIALGCLLLIVPGLVLLTRWAVAVPVAMLEETSATGALKRSREMVRGNGWNVFKIVFATGLLTGGVALLFGLVSSGLGPFGMWLALTLGSALTAPYTAHALTIVYYTLREPGRPVVLEPGRRWNSVWHEEDAAPEDQSVDDEYQRRFDEREQRWGG